MDNNNDVVYAEIDENGVRNLSSDWIKGMMEEREAVFAMITYALEHGHVDDLDGRTSLSMLHAAIGFRTEFTD
jgi:hypothetical protein